MPRRWTDLDSDEYRLPGDLRRVGYDADERRHYFRDGDGRMWQSQPGNEYGVLVPVRPEPPVTIPRRPSGPQPPPPYSRESADDPQPKESSSTFKFFTDILRSHQITSAPSSTPKRSHTINIPTVASLKRSSTTAASFIRSRGKHFTKSGHSKGPSHDDDSQRSPPTIKHRRIFSSPVSVGGPATTTASSSAAHARDIVEPSVERVDGESQASLEVGGGNRHEQGGRRND